MPWTIAVVVGMLVSGLGVAAGSGPGAATASSGSPADRPVAVGHRDATTPAVPGPTGRTPIDPPGPLAPGRSVSASATTGTTGVPPARFSSIRMGSFHLPGPHPQSWGDSAVPPGAPFAVGPVPSAPAGGPAASASENSSVFWSGHCAGLYPATGNATYYDGCVGHDEPGIQFYSPVPGSAGNITWNVTLPVDVGPSQNQSNLYVAVWFGMTLSDPLAWLDQCFLELQLYPDSSWSVPAVSGEWIGAAVAWQIEAATGYEDPCYYSPLYLHGLPTDGYFNMTGGDQLTVAMSGWENDPWGENISLIDRTQHTTSNLTLVDPYSNLPLDPAYSTNSYENGLQWTPGGEYPSVFAFETGHGRNPAYPTNTTFNYCAPGPPPATAANPDVPCPSYDPGSWSNDTAQPWRIEVPTFGTGTRTAPAAQVSFSQDLGGIDLDAGAPGCPGNLGSAYCSYPWYSYSCATHSFQFGATDYPGVSEDFGKYLEFATSAESNDLGFGYYPPTNFTIPTCGAASASVNLSIGGPSGGSVYFLSHDYGSAAVISGLAPGAYSLDALASGAVGFDRWAVTGALAVGSPTAAWTTLWVNGSGNLSASFQSSPPATVAVTFDDWGAAGSVAVLPSYLRITAGAALATAANGSSVALVPQIYGLLADAPPGYNFTHWAVNGSGAVIAASGLPTSWLLVDGAAARVTVTAWYAASSTFDSITVAVSGNGTVNLSGSSGSSFSETLRVGSYPVVADPGPGWSFQGWYAGGSAAIPDNGPSSNLTLENGSSYLYAYFGELPVAVLLEVAPAAGGTVSVIPGSFDGNNTTLELPVGTTSVGVRVATGYRFLGWTVNQSGAGWVESPGAAVSNFVVNRTVRLTADLVAAPLVTVSFRADPPAGGSIEFNFRTYGNGSQNTTANGSYALAFAPSPGYSEVGVGASGPLSVGSGVLQISGGGGVLTVDFQAIPPVPVAVTFVSEPVGAMFARIQGTAVTSGDTRWILPGTYSLAVTTAAADTFAFWTTAGGVGVTPGGPSATLSVSGGGTIYAIGAPFVVRNVSVAPAVVDVGRPILLGAVATGAGPFAYAWSGVPGGCPTGPLRSGGVSCTPTVPGTYAVRLTVTDTEGASLGLGPFGLTVTPLPQIQLFSASPSAFTLGVSTLLSVVTANPPGGVPPLTFEYPALPSGCAPADTAVLVCTPDRAGNSTVTARVVDASGAASEANLTLAVAPLPQISSFAASRLTVTEGAVTNLSVAWTGGTGPLGWVYTDLPTGCVSEDGPRLACSPNGAGTFSPTVRVTDADGFVAVATLSPLVVNPPPSIQSFAANPDRIPLGNTTELTVAASGGTGNLSYRYTGLPGGCGPSVSPALACRPAATGNFTIGVTVTDADGIEAVASVLLAVTTPVPASPTHGGAPGTPSWEWALLGVAGVAALAVGIVVGLRRRRVA